MSIQVPGWAATSKVEQANWAEALTIIEREGDDAGSYIVQHMVKLHHAGDDAGVQHYATIAELVVEYRSATRN